MKNFVRKSLASVCLILLMFHGFMNTTVCAQIVSLERGDVILSINGQSISGTTDFVNAVNHSPQRMFFTVKDGRTGKIAEMYATLGTQQGQRFGVSSQNATGGGVMITLVKPGAAARQCTRVGNAVGAAGRGGNPLHTSPKIHILFVWGTKATDTYWATMISKTKIEESFNDKEKIDLPKNSPRVGTWMVLEGDNAHPKEIISACQAISTKAGENDAIFVYILCHGATAVEDGDATGTRVHGLSPVCLNAQNLKFREIGIRRASIMKAIQTKPHRLCVLVTDSCSVMAGPDLDMQFAMAPSETMQQSLLANFLLTARGVLDINSSDPNSGNMKQGELAMAWTPNLDLKGAAYIAKSAQDPFAGTVFTNAFLSFAEQEMTPNTPCSPEKFYEDLKMQVKDQYKETKKMVMNTSSKGIEVFMSQPSQTVTRFAPNGTALPNQ